MNHGYEYHITWTRTDEPEKHAAQTGHEDRRHEMRRQKKRNKKDKRINIRANENELSPPASQENQKIPRRATDLYRLRPAEIGSKSLRLFALRPRANNRRLR